MYNAAFADLDGVTPPQTDFDDVSPFIYVVRVRPDERFVRDGDDLHTAVRLTMTEAALGTTTTVTSLSGEVPLEVPPGTQPGEVRVLRAQGMALLVAQTRVESGVHSASEVASGALLGALVTLFLFQVFG